MLEVQAVAAYLIFSEASETAGTIKSEEKEVQNCLGLLFQSFPSFLLGLRPIKQLGLNFGLCMEYCIKIHTTNEAGMHRPGVYCTVFKTKHRIQGCLVDAVQMTKAKSVDLAYPKHLAR